MINKSLIKFHETFQPESSYLAKILGLAIQNYSGTKYEISELTGIPTGKQKGKVEPHIKYASYMGLVDYTFEKSSYNLSATSLGKEVFVQDQFLHESLTHWLCHYGISRKEFGAPQWQYLIRDGHSAFSQINSSEYHLNRLNLLYEINTEFEETFGVARRTYLDGFFSDINFLHWEDGIEYVEHVFNYENIFVYAYVLLNDWDYFFPQKQEITFNQIIDELEFGKVFNFSADEVDNVLNELSGENIITINRQLYPATVVRLTSKDAIISKLYSRLF